jgi:hypothetical protein
VERPLELAELLLDDPSRWNMRRIEEAAESGRNQKVRLPRPVTILLMYWTVEVGQDGTIYFKKDPTIEMASCWRVWGVMRTSGPRPMTCTRHTARNRHW